MHAHYNDNIIMPVAASCSVMCLYLHLSLCSYLHCLCITPKQIEPGHVDILDRSSSVPSLVYTSRADAGMPAISPKVSIYSVNTHHSSIQLLFL
jgi:hypothetical protein